MYVAESEENGKSIYFGLDTTPGLNYKANCIVIADGAEVMISMQRDARRSVPNSVVGATGRKPSNEIRPAPLSILDQIKKTRSGVLHNSTPLLG